MANTFPSNAVAGGGGGGLAIIEKRELFTSNDTWNKPSNLVGDVVHITGIAGGGSGANGSTAATGGSGGQFVYDMQVDVTGLDSVAITIGAGGAAAAAPNAGNVGSPSSFGALVTLAGGMKGQTNAFNPFPGETNGGTLGATNAGTAALGEGQDNPCPFGGTGGLAGSANDQNNGGGGGLILDDSGTKGGTSPTTSVAYGGFGYGAGGGAGRNLGTAGEGAPGAILVCYNIAVTL